MKKILTTIAVSVIMLSAAAQSNKLASSQISTNTTNVNSPTEDPHNPLVNGIPYSQYKAQQEALKQQKLANVQKQIAAHANMKTIMEKQAAQAKANKGKASTLDVYNKKHKEEFLKQKAEVKAQKGTKTVVTH